jgi:hypothetical protein
MSSSFRKNEFECECTPTHTFDSVEEFNQHFSSIYHKYHECASKTLFQDYMKIKEDLRKLKEERDMWKTMYQDEIMKDTFL